MRTNLLRRAAAAGASAAIAVTGLAALAPAANAVSAPITYSCDVSILKAQKFSVVVDTDLPDSVKPGTTTPVGVTATVTVPVGVVGALGLIGAASLEGTASVDSTLNDVPLGDTVLQIPSTPVPTVGAMTIQATGSGPAFAPTENGTQVIKAGDFSGVLTLRNAAGEELPSSPTNLICTVEEGQDLTVDSVNVTDETAPEVTPETPATKAGSTTAVKKVKFAKKKKRINVTAQVRTADKKAAKGKVKVTLKKGKKTVKVIKGKKLNKKGIAKVNFKKITKKGKYKVIVQYQGNKNTKKSKKSRVIRVK